MNYQKRLFQRVVENSVADNFEEAKLEWVLDGFTEYETNCICGKQHILKVFSIKNKINHNVLTPIGSECITRFHVKELTEYMKIYGRKDEVFKNEGKKHDGLTYETICVNHPEYIMFLKTLSKMKSKYEKLIRYYDCVHLQA